MKKLKISLDFMFGPIWKDEFIDGEACTGVPAVDNDEILQKLNEEISELYTSYYEFDSHGETCWFDKEREKADKQKMLNLLSKLNNRLAEVNDGSFEVDDLETARVQAL